MLLALFVGILFVAIFFFILRQMMRLAEDNSFKISETINQIAQVYIPIPEQKKGRGKISISVRGSVHEIDALTNSESRIGTGASVRIVTIEDAGLVVVEKI
jgi:membrane protein implicated in regulation of membrane protease activity